MTSEQDVFKSWESHLLMLKVHCVSNSTFSTMTRLMTTAFNFVEKGYTDGMLDTQIQPQTSVSTVKHRVPPCYNTDMCPTKLVRTKKSVN